MEKNNPSNMEKNNLPYKKIIYFLIIIAVFLLIIFLLNYLAKSLTGKAVLGITTSYKENETLKGTLSLSLKEGELIPADSIVTIKMPSNSYNYKLSDLVTDKTVNGNFYAEGSSLSGGGEGYGFSGKKKSYPDVNFTLKITKTGSTSETSTGGTTETSSSNTTSETTTPEDNSSTLTSGTTETTTTETTTTPATTSTTTSTTPTTETTSTIPTTPTTTTPTIPTTETIKKEEKAEEKVEKKDEKSEEKKDEKTITGGVVAELTKEVEGKVSKNSPYTYQLEDGEDAEIASSLETVSISKQGNKITITTDHEKDEKGFGEQYLGNSADYKLNIDLSSLNLTAESGELSVTVDYNSLNIASVSTTLSVENPEQTVTNVTTTNLTSNISSNATNISIKTENLSDFSLTAEELFILKGKTGASSVEITKAEVINGRLFIRFEIGTYWLENSYDNTRDKEELNSEIELDRARWVKYLARALLEGHSEAEAVEGFVGPYNITSS